MPETARKTTAARRTGRGAPSSEELDKMLDKALPLEDDATPADPTAAYEVHPPTLAAYRTAKDNDWPLINLLIAQVMREVGPVGKTSFNEQQKFNFRGIDDVVNAAAAAVRRAGIFPRCVAVKPQYRDAHTTAGKPTREVTLIATYRFEAPDGSHVDVEVPGEALDQSDKGTAKAMSVSLRIALLQLLFLPTTEPDPDASYVTREGAGALGAATTKLLLDLVRTQPLAVVLGEVLPVVREHAAWDRDVHGEEGRTWAAVLIERAVADIQALPGIDGARALLELLDNHKANTWRSGNTTLEKMLEARAPELKEVAQKTFDHVMEELLVSGGQDELDVAVGCGAAAVEAGTLPVKWQERLLQVAADRRPNLPEVAPEPPEDQCDDALALEVHEPHVYLRRDERYRAAKFSCRGVTEAERAAVHGPTDEQAADEPPADPEDEERRRAAEIEIWNREWAALQLRLSDALKAQDVEGALMAAIVSDGWGWPAERFGMDGLQRVADAVAAAHRRDHVIGDEPRARLDAALAEAADRVRAASEPAQ
jgi:hypothetical protein